MAVKRIKASPAADEPQIFFISLTDIMVGVLFLFIIAVMFFALRLEHATTRGVKLVAALTTTETVRATVLASLQDDLASRGIQAMTNPRQGVLSLPESILFDKNKAELSRHGEEIATVLAQSLYKTLACYTGMPPAECSGTSPAIEAVLIEGHTDGDGADVAVWTLSVKRSFSVFQVLMAVKPDLARLTNRNRQTIFSIAGYGRQRPFYPGDTEENKRMNGRIDIHLIMTPPETDDVRVTP